MSLKLDDWDKLRVIKDGDCFAVVGPDFVDLQSSPAVFFTPEDWQHNVIEAWFVATPLVHLPLSEVANIIHRLNDAEKDER